MIFKSYSYEVVLPILKNSFLRKMVDFNILAITSWLDKNTANIPLKNKRVLDIGAGASEYRKYFKLADYKTCDIDSEGKKHDFQRIDQIKNLKFDIILLIEVLEHVKDTHLFLEDVLRLLENSGEVWITLPFNARYHPCPNDYYRWTIEGIHELLNRNQLEIIILESRGNTLTTCAQKLLWFVYSHRSFDWLLLVSPLLLFCIIPFLYLIAHLSMLSGYKDEDPQGHCLRVKPCKLN